MRGREEGFFFMYLCNLQDVCKRDNGFYYTMSLIIFLSSLYSFSIRMSVYKFFLVFIFSLRQNLNEQKL